MKRSRTSALAALTAARTLPLPLPFPLTATRPTWPAHLPPALRPRAPSHSHSLLPRQVASLSTASSSATSAASTATGTGAGTGAAPHPPRLSPPCPPSSSRPPPRGVFFVDDASLAPSSSSAARGSLSVSLRSFSPPPPRSDEVRVRVHAVSVNPIDVMTRRGYGRTLIPLLSPYPRLVGRDGSGVVEGVGSSVWQLPVGARVWFSRDAAGDGCWAEQLNVARRELSEAPRRLSLHAAAAFPFVWTTLWTALVDAANIRPRSVREMSREGRERRERTALGSDASAAALPSALVHGAGGPLGRLAVRTLRAWGYSVTATLRAHQSAASIKRSAQHIVRTAAEGEEEQDSSADSSWTVSTPPSWVSLLPERGGYSLFLDCVGGAASEAAAVQSLRAGSGVYVTLRGELVDATDHLGLVRGGLRAMQTLALRKAAFAARGLRYHWAINRCNSDALAYLARAIDEGCIVTEEDAGERQPSEEADIQLDGIEQAVRALDESEQRKPQGKLLIALRRDGDEEHSLTQPHATPPQ